jgi:hypothetical protein
MTWQWTAQWWLIKGLKLTYNMAWKWRGGLTQLLTRCSREASLFNCQMIESQNRYQTRRDTSMCFGWRKTSEIFLRAMTPSWSAHGTLYLCFPMKNFRMHSRMASYDGVFSRQHSIHKISSEWHFWSCIYSVIECLSQSRCIYRVVTSVPTFLCACSASY